MSTHPHIHGTFRARDGARLYYAVEGPVTAPPLLFCYGLVCSRLQWKYQMDYFKQHYRVIFMDYRGHGQSDRAEDPRSVTIENCARDLLELLDELELPPLPILAHSLGVNIALDLYRLAPERVTGFVLANGTPKDPFETMFHHNFLQVLFPFVKKARTLFPDILRKFWLTQGTSRINQEFVARAGFNTKYAKREDINEYLRLASLVDLDTFLWLLSDFMNYDATHWLHEVRVPTLVLAGEWDRITPSKNQRIFAGLIPHSKFYVVPEGSHCPQLEKPDLVNQVIGNFLYTLEKKKKTPKPKGKKKAGAVRRASL